MSTLGSRSSPQNVHVLCGKIIALKKKTVFTFAENSQLAATWNTVSKTDKDVRKDFLTFRPIAMELRRKPTERGKSMTEKSDYTLEEGCIEACQMKFKNLN